MTLEEQEIFINTIKETIMPIASNMTEEQIKNIIVTVQDENPDLPEGFSNMLYEEIIILKYQTV